MAAHRPIPVRVLGVAGVQRDVASVPMMDGADLLFWPDSVTVPGHECHLPAIANYKK
jgi:hypothetical protein